MANENEVTIVKTGMDASSKTVGTSSRSFWAELLRADPFKPTQGRMVRQVTCGAIWTVVALGAWQAYEYFLREMSLSWMGSLGEVFRYGLPFLMLAAGLWVGYRLVCWPPFADFLISVEGEMNKVSWPMQTELVRASMVVIFTIFFMAMLLFGYDAIWQLIFSYLKIS
jgi:preprotein translocase subunit SecE